MGNPTMLDRVFHVIMERMVETGEPHREDMVQRIGTKPQCYPLGLGIGFILIWRFFFDTSKKRGFDFHTATRLALCCTGSNN